MYFLPIDINETDHIYPLILNSCSISDGIFELDCKSNEYQDSRVV